MLLILEKCEVIYMANYAITRVEKRKKQDVAGIQIEANRDRKIDHEQKGREFYLSDINWAKTDDNIHLKKSKNWTKYINNQLAKNGIDNYRKDAVMMLDGLYTASPEFFDNKSKDEMINFFKDCYNFHVKYYCGGDESLMINAVIHLDETTPHMQLASVPILHDLEQNKNVLSAKRIMGNRGDYRQKQDSFFKEVGQKWQLDRGEKSDPKAKREHKEKLQYEVERLTKESEMLSIKMQAKMEAFENAKSQMEKLTQRLDQSMENVKNNNKNHSSFAGMGKVIIDEKVFNELTKYSEIEKTLSGSLSEIFSEINQQNKNIINMQALISDNKKLSEIIDKKTNNNYYKTLENSVNKLQNQEMELIKNVDNMQRKYNYLVNEINDLYDTNSQYEELGQMIEFAEHNKEQFEQFKSKKRQRMNEKFFDDIDI